MKQLKFLIFSFTMLFVFVGAAAAAVNPADFKINGEAVNAGDTITITPSEAVQLEYSGDSWISTVTWQIKYEETSEWITFDCDESAEIKIHRTGKHNLKIVVRSWNSWFSYGFSKGTLSDKEITLNLEESGYTQTKHPILLVPGVLGFDDIDLLGLGVEYFYNLDSAINETSDVLVHNVSLNPWQGTVPRGQDLAKKIINFLEINFEPLELDKTGVDRIKVNLIAHSHGATTSRVALRELAEDPDKRWHNRIASLTTVAGPHYGSPTADGGVALFNDVILGDLAAFALKDLLFQGLAGTLVSLSSGHPEYVCEQDLQSVMVGFSQNEMYRFNNITYPSVGVPHGGQYVFQNDFIDVENGFDPENPLTKEQMIEFAGEDMYTNKPNEAYGFNTYNEAYRNGEEVNENDDPVFYKIKERDEDGNDVKDENGNDVLISMPEFYDIEQEKGDPLNLPLVIGDAKGNVLGPTDDSAIQYYSFMGKTDTTFTNSNLINIVGDGVLEIFHQFYNLVDDGDGNWGYENENDSFVPVDSSRFGYFLGTHDGWNHLDEQNQFFGHVGVTSDGKAADDPLAVYVKLVNRLKNAGL